MLSENGALLHGDNHTHQRNNERGVIALPLSPLESPTPQSQGGGDDDEGNTGDAERDKPSGIVCESIRFLIVNF